MDLLTVSMQIEQVLQIPNESLTVHRLRQGKKLRNRKQSPCQASDRDEQHVHESDNLDGKRTSSMPSSPGRKRKPQVTDSLRIRKLSALQQSQFHSTSDISATMNVLPSLSYPLQAQQSKLIHHYTAVAIANISSAHTPQSKSLWTAAIPRLAFASPVVFHALLAVSALHLSFLLPNEHDLAQASLKHHTRALSLQRKALTNVTPMNAEPILAASVLLGTHAWLSSHITDAEDGEDKYEIPIRTYRMIRGVGTLSSQIAPLLPFNSPDDWYNNTSSRIDQVLPSLNPEDHITPWLNPAKDSVEWYVDPESPTLSSHPPPAQQRSPSRQAFLLEAQQDLSRLFTAFSEDPAPPQEAFTYRLALVELSTLYSVIASPSHSFSITEAHRRILNFPLRLPKNFLDALEKERPIAIALLARSLALMCVVGGEDAWWIFGAGVGEDGQGVKETVPAREVRGLASLVSEEWKWVMEWPLKVVNGEMKIKSQVCKEWKWVMVKPRKVAQ